MSPSGKFRTGPSLAVSHSPLPENPNSESLVGEKSPSHFWGGDPYPQSSSYMLERDKLYLTGLVPARRNCSGPTDGACSS